MRPTCHDCKTEISFVLVPGHLVYRSLSGFTFRVDIAEDGWIGDAQLEENMPGDLERFLTSSNVDGILDDVSTYVCAEGNDVLCPNCLGIIDDLWELLFEVSPTHMEDEVDEEEEEEEEASTPRPLTSEVSEVPLDPGLTPPEQAWQYWE